MSRYHVDFYWPIVVVLLFANIPSKQKTTCPVCCKSIKRSDDLIQCNFCDKWIHRVKCCLLSNDKFIQISNDVEMPWCCPKCAAETLPFTIVLVIMIYLLRI